MEKIYKIGQIVPSSNTTMETEIPAMLKARQLIRPEKFTFHSSRMRMKHVKKEELAAMDAQSDRCALELSDAKVDVLGYACLVAIMSMGMGYHRESEKRLHQVTIDNDAMAPIVTSAGALVEATEEFDVSGGAGIVQKLNYQDADVIVLSACVQMQSLPAVSKVEALTGKPVISAAIATTYQMLKALDLEPVAPGAGALLSGAYA